jgi:hypothetical protein
LDVLSELSRDPAWFVRLRAIVGLGKFSVPRMIPVLLGGLGDSNRLVRLRAAEALVTYPGAMLAIFQKVVAIGDGYALHAYLTAVENADLLKKLETEMESSRHIAPSEKARLEAVLSSGSLAAEELSLVGASRAAARS